MSQEELFHSCVGKLYEMALEPQGWGAFLDDFCTLIDAAFAHYVAWGERADAMLFSASSRSSPTGSEQAYIDHYGAIDLRRKLITERADGKWVLCHEQFDERYVSQSPVGDRYFAVAKLGEVNGVIMVLGVHRGKDRGPFDSREMVWLERIKPHLQRAARLHMEVRQFRLQASLATNALDALRYPVMIVDEQARVQLANASADRWLRGGVTRPLGWLRDCVPGSINSFPVRSLRRRADTVVFGWQARSRSRTSHQPGTAHRIPTLSAWYRCARMRNCRRLGSAHSR